VDVHEAIQQAEALLPGEPLDVGPDPRWQAIVAVAAFIEPDSEHVWAFIAKWGSHHQDDLRAAVATCLLEHLLEHKFAAFFPRVEQLALENALFADTFLMCWKFGDCNKRVNAQRFDDLRVALSSSRRDI
jgi:hypothetical protein